MKKIFDKITDVAAVLFWITIPIYFIVITVFAFKNYRLDKFKKLYEIQTEQKRSELLDLQIEQFKNKKS